MDPQDLGDARVLQPGRSRSTVEACERPECGGVSFPTWGRRAQDAGGEGERNPTESIVRWRRLGPVMWAMNRDGEWLSMRRCEALLLSAPSSTLCAKSSINSTGCARTYDWGLSLIQAGRFTGTIYQVEQRNANESAS